ncbi:MAG: formate acetyltransferase [Myxococcales bacterium]|nr:formate acetyltransferase [Myxococcales bacterium]
MPARTGRNWLVPLLLHLFAANYGWRPRLRRYLKSRDGWMDFTVGFRTLDGTIRAGLRFRDGRVQVLGDAPPDADTELCFRDKSVIRKMLRLPPNEVMNLLLRNELSIRGNLATMSKFNFLLSVLLEKKHRRMAARQAAAQPDGDDRPADREGSAKLAARRRERLPGKPTDAVRHLDDPYLAEYSLDDFPRLRKFLNLHFTQKPEICAERAVLLTQWFRENGFETDAQGRPWVPVLRQAAAFRFFMAHKTPRLRADDLLAGTTTAKEIGVVLYPDTHGTMIWGELLSAPYRPLNPYDISQETRRVLHEDVFPYWEKRNVREIVRRRYHAPLCQQMDERFAVFFLWKTVAVSHTIPDFPRLLRLGTEGMIAEIEAEPVVAGPAGEEKCHLLEAMATVLAGVNDYADNLARQVAAEAAAEPDGPRRSELLALAAITARVPRQPARTLHEALQAIWTMWLALHQENTNAGLSLGRLDQWLQPFFAADLKAIADPEARRAYIRRAIELVGCFYLRCTDHLPLVPDIGNFLFGGSSSDQAITLGGVTPAGANGVNDMTYVFLKVTELLNIRDPNVNARFHPGINSDDYLRRLCEVNYLTAATPSLHNDRAVMASLAEFDYPPEHLRDWSATGCVEPTLAGRHMGHTNCMMMNMVAALEMALHNGRHPLMNWDLGPKTGPADNATFATFDRFFAAFAEQYRFLIDQACEYNNLLGTVHGEVRPTPLLSSLLDGCRQSGRDASRGGARYNTSGAACIGLADVTDSLLAIKTLVYDARKVSLAELRRAVDDNFAGAPAWRALALKKAPKFGSGDPEALAMADRVTRLTHDAFAAQANYRGGRYTAGFWSMSNHVAFGCLSGALPSGRLAGKPFTPGLTPVPNASENLLDPIRDVAALRPEQMNNNIAFNVKIVPGPRDTHAQAVDNIRHYVKTYFELGGMQMQFNVVTSAILRDAMAHPEDYRNLLVRISGYNAYFVTLNRDLQLELIQRAEYGIS